ncbi:MAG TPA: hypothetical protein VHU83_12535 [Bryobacteraceae bacterium]|jgi:hypothetical protein|nr:hypothetical protein [Bryobacteraceae bacterium]
MAALDQLFTLAFLFLVCSPLLFLIVMAWRWAAEMLRLARAISRSLEVIADKARRSTPGSRAGDL